MKEKNEEILNFLFETKAFQPFENNEPFWYTSGKIGPYYINTHYLYGSKLEAEELLRYINSNLDNKEKLDEELFEITYKHYEENKIFKSIIDCLVNNILKTLDIGSIKYISGGERRDWFFSYPVARILGKTHLSIFKDGEIIANSKYDICENVFNQFGECQKNLTKQELNLNTEDKIVHIVDLITEASSFASYWIPSLEKVGAKIEHCFSIVDRMQGGKEFLKKSEIELSSIFRIDTELFNAAKSYKLIDDSQYRIIVKYLKNPDETMRKFIENNPEFIIKSLNSDDEKIRSRAENCAEKKIYKNIYKA